MLQHPKLTVTNKSRKGLQMLNWKNLATLSALYAFGASQAQAEVVLELAPRIQFAEITPDGVQSKAALSTATVVGFDLEYRAAQFPNAAELLANDLHDAKLVPEKEILSPRGPRKSAMPAFDYTKGGLGFKETGRSVTQLAAVSPIPPAGSESEPVSMFGQFAQRWKNSPSSELSGSHASAGEQGATDLSQAAVKSSGMPLIGYGAASASLMGVAVGMRRRWLGKRVAE